MSLSDADQTFLRKRKKLSASAKTVCIGLLALVLLICAWQFFNAPNLINPFHVARAISDNSLTTVTASSMALLTPILAWLVWGLVLLLILIIFAVSRLEKRYHTILEKLLP